MSTRAYRVAPRGGTSRRGSSRVDWERLGRISLVVILFVIVILYVNPVVNFVDAWRDLGTERTQLETLKEENAGLRSRAATLDRPDAEELGARKLGMVKPDERSVVICQPGVGPGCETSAP